MTTLKQLVLHVLSKNIVASVILALLLPCLVQTRVLAKSPKLPPLDPTRLVFDSVAGDYGNIYNVIQDKDGFLWLAGINGAIKYNGYEVETIYSGETVSALFQDSEGLIWMIIKSGVAVYDKNTGKTIKYIPNPNEPNALSGESMVHSRKPNFLLKTGMVLSG